MKKIALVLFGEIINNSGGAIKVFGSYRIEIKVFSGIVATMLVMVAEI